MNTPNPEIQIPAPGRRHNRYSLEFKREVIAACLEPGVSKAAIALANGLNANMLRRWVVESSPGRTAQLTAITTPPLPAVANPDFIPVPAPRKEYHAVSLFAPSPFGRGPG